MSAAIPWYKSPQTLGLITTFIAALVALFPKIGAALGLTSPSAISNAVSTIAGAVALIAPVVGTIVRTQSKEQPITLTQAAADAHPATIAAHVEQTMSANMLGTTPHPPIATPIPGQPWGK